MDALINTPEKAMAPTNTQFKFGYYAGLSSYTNIADLNQHIDKIINRLGFTQYIFTNLSRSHVFQPELTSLPNEMISRYHSMGLYEQDMNLQRAQKNTYPFFHSTIHEYVNKAPFKSDMTLCMQEILELYKAYGYYDFYSIPLTSHLDNHPVMLTVTRRGINPIELKQSVAECDADLRLLCEAIDFVTIHNFPEIYGLNDSPKNTIINPKPLRVLDTLANNDLTINQVADKLCISVVTANQHLKTVRRSLGTHTNYAAIKKAVFKGLIQLNKNHQYTPAPNFTKTD